MYTPRHNRMEDRAALVAFMRAHPFATLVTHGVEGLCATHLPAVVAADGERVLIEAHLAKANAQWGDFAAGTEALVIFSEPHAYVSPRHYERAEAVPTWNYAAVHAYGVPRIVDDRDAKHAQQTRLVGMFDAEYAERFPHLASGYMDRMLAAIVSFTIEVVRLQARFKLSQEKLPVERGRIIATLDASGDSAAAETARLMREHGR